MSDSIKAILFIMKKNAHLQNFYKILKWRKMSRSAFHDHMYAFYT